MLQNIVDTPWYVRNQEIDRDLKILTVADEIKKSGRQAQGSTPLARQSRGSSTSVQLTPRSKIKDMQTV